MVESGKHPSAIVFVRHGETTYSNSFPSLTDKGREQIGQTAVKLTSLISEFDSVVAISSPSARARESMQIILETIGRTPSEIRTSGAIRPFDMKDLAGFLAYDKQHSTPRYGQMWLTDPYLYSDNPLTESRFAVESRALRFLVHGTHFLASKTSQETKSYLLLVATHFEIMAPIMKAIYTNKQTFPIETEDAPQLGEELVLHIDDPNVYQYRVKARGRVQPVKYHPQTRCFG